MSFYCHLLCPDPAQDLFSVLEGREKEGETAGIGTIICTLKIPAYFFHGNDLLDGSSHM